MTMHLPKDLESSILAAVQSGRYASLDDAMTEARVPVGSTPEAGAGEAASGKPGRGRADPKADLGKNP